MEPAFEALVNVIPVLAKAKASERIEDTEQKQRMFATQLADKRAMNVKLITARVNGEIGQDDFHTMGMLCRVVSAVAKALWISAPLSQKQTVQSVLFPNGICYRTDIGFFEPVTNELEMMVFQGLLGLSVHGDAYKEQVSGLRHS